jgi:prefoldin subunit 5
MSINMPRSDYQRALETAIREYETLGRQRQDIDRRLAEVAQTIGTLSRLCGLISTVPIGLTDACRLVVRGAGVPVTPIDVRQRLQSIGFDLSKYSNDLAAIHTILKRLNESGELRFIPRGADSAKHAYIWNHGPYVVALGADIAAFMRDNDIERDAMRATETDVPAAVKKPQPAARRSRSKRS